MAERKERLPFFLPEEIAEHNAASDCWVSKFGKVYDVTPLCEKYPGVLVQPILKFAGQDISHWFDSKTKQPRTYVDPNLNVRMPYCPHGRYVHIPPPEPVNDWDTDIGTPWWDDEQYLVGHLSQAKRRIKIVNNLSGQEDQLNVCAEETLEEIRQRYLRYNRHAHSYTWKWLGRPLNMDKTLSENGVKDESAEFASLGIDEAEFVPAIHLSFNDDLTCS